MAAPDSHMPLLGGDPSVHPTDPHFRPPRGWGRPLWRRLAVAAGLGLFALLVLVLLARAYLGSDAMRAKVQERVSRLISERLGGGSVGSDYAVDWLGRVRIGPVRLAPPSGPAAVEIGWVAVRPSYRALLSGRAEPASVLLHDVQVDAGSGGSNLASLLDRIRRSQHRGHPSESVTPRALPLVRFDTLLLRVETRRFQEPLALGFENGRLELRRSVMGGELDSRASFQAGGGVEAHASWSRGGPFTVDGSLRNVSVDVVPDPLRSMLPFQLSEGLLSANVRTLAPAGLHRGALRVSLDLASLTLAGPRLSEEPVGPVRVAFDGDLRWDTAWQRVTLEQGELSVGPHQEAKVQVDADLVLRGEPRFSFSAHVDKLAYQAALDALPRALVPDENAPRLDGTMTGAVAVSGPLHQPDAWKVDAKLDISDLKEAAKQQAPIFLKNPFEYRTVDAAGREHTVWVGLKNRSFVPFSELPTYVYRAVTTSEDAGFFAHHGFDFDELKNSIVADAMAGRAVRGGSTITQQLAKNLFLSREKTYARKVREALITIALEASLSKQRLLEIYLNIIEWGPGIYGIGDAAQHYFGKDARALTPKEAAFLATIIPNPIRYHMYYDRGALTDAWEKHVDDLLAKMAAVNVITPDQLATALATPLVFARPDPAPAKR